MTVDGEQPTDGKAAKPDAVERRRGSRRGADREAVERRHGRRRRADKLTPRDLVYLAGLALIAAAIIIAIRSDTHTSAADKRSAQANRHASQAIAAERKLLGQVQEGRRTGITITCAAISSFGAAGKAVIAGSPKPPPPAEEKALEQLGFPAFAARHRQQANAGALYVAAISRRINYELRQLGENPVKGLVRKDGTIDCKVLQRVSAIPNPR